MGRYPLRCGVLELLNSPAWSCLVRGHHGGEGAREDPLPKQIVRRLDQQQLSQTDYCLSHCIG